jgi:hypothetical protein
MVSVKLCSGPNRCSPKEVPVVQAYYASRCAC